MNQSCILVQIIETKLQIAYQFKENNKHQLE